jgi:putative transposase
LAEIKNTTAGQPTYGYRRIHALIRRHRARDGGPPVKVKRIYRVMKVHRLLLERHTGTGQERRHEGRVAVDHPDTRWCSDGFEFGCDNGERVRIALPPTAAAGRRSPGWRRPAASIAVTSGT